MVSPCSFVTYLGAFYSILAAVTQTSTSLNHDNYVPVGNKPPVPSVMLMFWSSLPGHMFLLSEKSDITRKSIKYN